MSATLSGELATAIAELQVKLGTTLHPTGSHVICPGAVTDLSDRDFVGCVPSLNSAVNELLIGGWETGASLGDDPDQDLTFVSLRQGDVNLILTNKADWLDRFLLATRVATQLGLDAKDHRICLFQAILYGKG